MIEQRRRRCRAWLLPGVLLCGGCALSPWQLDRRDGPPPPSPFTRLDQDRDGWLGPAEFGAGGGVALHGDADGDGRLDYPEFQAWLPTRMQLRVPARDASGSRGDGGGDRPAANGDEG